MMIRKANCKDYKAIYILNRDGMDYDYPLDKTKKRLEKVISTDGDIILVAEIENKIVGYIHLESYDCTYSDSLKNILALVVDEGCRKKGVGKALIMEAENWAKSDGACGIRLVSGYNRIGAHMFYEACGYTSRKDQKNFVKLF